MDNILYDNFYWESVLLDPLTFYDDSSKDSGDPMEWELLDDKEQIRLD